MEDVVKRLKNLISRNDSNAIIGENENQIVLNDPSKVYPPLTITRDGQHFHLKDIQTQQTKNSFQTNMTQQLAVGWNGNESLTQSEMLTEVEWWLNKLRNPACR